MKKRVATLSCFAAASFTALFTGCAEGPLWQVGHYSPWARDKWAAEEQIADTLFARKNEMNGWVETAVNGSYEQKEAAAEKLFQTLHQDKILLLRLHAVKLLGQLDSPKAIETLKSASRDAMPDVRIASIQSWSRMPSEVAVPQLQDIILSDTNIDVRLAATRALSNFTGSQTVQALASALNDSDPAIQVRATESLAAVTGESIGRDVSAWQDYVARSFSGTGESIDRMAEGEDENDGTFR